MLISVPSPRVNLLSGVVERLETIRGYTLLAELPVETFHGRAVHWFPVSALRVGKYETETVRFTMSPTQRVVQAALL